MSPFSVDANPLVVAPRWEALFARHGLGGLDDLFAIPGARRLDKPTLPGWRERLVLELADAAGQVQRFYLKRFRNPPWGPQLGRWLGGRGARSTAGLERQWIEALQGEGINVPEVAAFAEECRGWRERRSALVLAEVPGESLEKWVQRHQGPAPRAMRDELARFVARFHACGYVHRDLYLSHVFMVAGRGTENGETSASRATAGAEAATGAKAGGRGIGAAAERGRFWLIDLARVMHGPWRARRWWIRDLAQLNYSTPGTTAGPRARLRWLIVYLRARKLDRAQCRGILRHILRRTAAIERRAARRKARSTEPNGAGARTTRHETAGY